MRGVAAYAAVPVAAVAGSARGGATRWVVPHAAPASAVAGSARRGARRSVAAHAAPDAGSNHADADKDNHFYEVIETYTLQALEMLAAIQLPAALAGKAETLKSHLEEAVDAAKSRVPDKVSFVMDLLHNIYDVVNLVFECRSSGDFIPLKVCSLTRPEDKAMLKSGESIVFTINMDDEENMIRSVVIAVGIATGYTAGCGWLSKAQMAKYLKRAL
ncbi:uncharacterized protein LOC120695612 [Panicum virgatum]|nr:uncharacterized protein LOC120695612 [Panicum virgatum]